jgi:hypothetical protein
MKISRQWMAAHLFGHATKSLVWHVQRIEGNYAAHRGAVPLFF